MANKPKGMSGVKKAEIGAGIAATVAAAALGAYLLYGKDGAKNRKKVRGWTLKAKGEILEQVEKMGHVTEAGYQDVVNRVIASYRGAKNVTGPELMALATDARKHWKALKPLIKKAAKQMDAKKTASRKRKAAPKK
jgi:hypothetical protein